MASHPSPGGSKRHNFGKAIRHSYDQFKHAVLSPSGSSSRTPGSAVPVQGVTWAGLETALRVLAKGTNALPPLKSAVSELVDCLDIVQAAGTNVEDYEELTSELTTMAGTLNQYLSELSLGDPGGSAARIALSIEAEVMHISKQQGRSKGRRMIESAEDKEDVIKRYRRIERLFRQLQADIGLRTWRSINEQHMTTLLRGLTPIDDARYNSSYSTIVRRRGCTAETRERVQADLQDWVQDPDAAKVYWMNGMAGTGKTTIAYSLCEWLEANQRLGASFFCSRVSSSCCNVNEIIPTIAYQLTRYSSQFRSELCKILKEDPDVSKLNVVRQFEKLVREPMLAGNDTMPEGVVVVIDALDECEDDYGVRLVLGTLLRLGVDLPLKFFVTSRPEPAIRDNMLAPGRYPPTVLHLHDIEQSVVEGDIKKYLTEALSSMSPPPSDEQIVQLAKSSGKLFIYAATAVRYILPGKGSANSIARLQAMLAADSHSTDEGQASKKYKKLDELYTTVLAAAFDEEELEKKEIESMRLVLWTAVCAKEPMTAPAMASLLGLTEEQATSALQPLRSILHVSEAGGLVSTLHASFSDYMLDHLRSRNFHCDRTQHSEFLARRCFEVMKEQLRFNICTLDSSFTYDKDVPNLEQHIKACISPTLFYACRYWGEHLRLAGASDALHDDLADFLAHRLLFWMEVLNLKLCVVKGIPILVHAEKWLLTVRTPTNIGKQVADARDFVTRFASGACTRSTPHIYLSSLPFCAKSSLVYTYYWGRTRGVMGVEGTAISRRANAAQSTWYTNSWVESVAFSPDGTRIVSGSQDGTIRMHDAYSGDVILGPFRGHISSSSKTVVQVWDTRTDTTDGPQGYLSAVYSVQFSPNGARFVSGSDDRTIRVWDSHTGDLVVGPFEGHTDSVRSVAFSFNGSYIVSGSADRTIRVWDAHTGNTILGPLEGHTGTVRSVGFSPNSTRVVSGSADHTIRVWDAHTGVMVFEPFEGHRGPVGSVSFSPDGTRVVSGSSDWTIRVWDACTGNAIDVFKGHTGWVKSVAFSPDGARIVSGSDDRTIRVWNSHTGDLVAGPFKGHASTVNSVTFSSDGTRITSGSFDQTIRVWEQTGDIVAEPFQGHMAAVHSVTFSPDSARIVSGSADQTIRVWDRHTGDLITGPFEDTGRVYSVACSPDGTRIVSGSDDRTTRVWDTHTGDIVAGPFKKHTRLVNSVVFSPDGTRIVSGSHDQSIRVWDAHTGGTVAKLVIKGKGPYSSVQVTLYPAGTRIGPDDSDRIIRRAGDAIVAPLGEHVDPDSDSDLDPSPNPNPDCDWVENPDHFSNLGICLYSDISDKLVIPVAFSPDGAHIVAGCYENIRVWDARTGIITQNFRGHLDEVTSVAFSPDSTRIVSGSQDETIRVWNAHTGKIAFGPFVGHSDRVNSVAFSPDGTHVVSGSRDHTVLVWNASTGNVVAGPFKGHTDEVNSVAFSPDGTRIVSGASDGAIRVWWVPDEGYIDVLPNPVHQGHVRGAFTDISDFKLNNDGWVTTTHGPLLWIPPDLHAHMPFPHNTLVIGLQGSIYITNQPTAVGERWSECYRSQ